MTTDLLLRRIRTLTGNLDLEVSDLTDQEILDALQEAVVTLEGRGVLVEGTYTVESDIEQSGYGISPDPTQIDGNLLATRTAVDLLRAAYRGRLDRGELGISWSSGLEAESSISADKAYRAGIDSLEMELRELVAIRQSGTTGARSQ